MSDIEGDGPPRAVLLAALIIAVVAVGAVLAVAAKRNAAPPVVVSSVPAPQAADTSCTSLLAALPDRLGDYRRAELASPAPPGAAAWRADAAAEPVILRCGLDRPGDFVVGVPLQVVNAVSWLRMAEADRTTWFAVDRPVYIALTLPADSGPTPIQELSDTIAATLPATPLAPAPPR